MEAMHQRVAGIDVHRMKHVVTIVIDREDGAVSSETRAFGGFKRDMRALVAWLQTHRIQQGVMESTGIYWKSVFAHLEAAGKRKSGKTRHGNPIVRYLLCEAANAARRTKTVFRAKYESLVIRRGHKKTIIALAHKLVRTIFCVLVRRKPYRDSTVDYEAASVAKNAPRWIRALKK